jgi:hypothetical protein
MARGEMLRNVAQGEVETWTRTIRVDEKREHVETFFLQTQTTQKTLGQLYCKKRWKMETEPDCLQSFSFNHTCESCGCVLRRRKSRRIHRTRLATGTREHSTVSEAHPSTITNQTFAVARPPREKRERKEEGNVIQLRNMKLN